MNEVNLFHAIINQTIKDLYDEDHKERALQWILARPKAKSNGVTFIDCCDFTNRNPYKLRKLAMLIATDKIKKETLLDYFGE